MMVLPPPYPLSARHNHPGASSAPSAVSSTAAPVPHFDSILRAAPAFDAEDDDDVLETLSSSSSSSSSSSILLRDHDGVAAPGWLASKIAPHAEQHRALHAYLDAHTGLEQQIHQTQEQIHIDAGKITSTAAKTARLQRQLDSLRLEGGAREKGKLFWTPKRRREWRHEMQRATAELQPTVTHLREAEEALLIDREKLGNLHAELIEYKKVEARLDSIDDEIFRGITVEQHRNGEECAEGEEDQDEDDVEQQYHILLHTQRRLRAAVKVEERAQKHLSKAYQLSQALIKELLAGLNIGIEIGVPTNLKHKNGLWKGTSPIHSANRARNHVLRAKTLCGDLHTNYILARAVQRRVALMTKLHVIELNRLPGMNARNAVDEMGLHRSLEQSYAQAKIAKSHIENQSRSSRQRQEQLKTHIRELTGEAKSTWLRLRRIRRRIVEREAPNNAQRRPQHQPGQPRLNSPHVSLYPDRAGSDVLPPYKRNPISSSTLALPSPPPTNDIMTTTTTTPSAAIEISLPHAFRRRVERESIARCKDIVLQVAIEIGGVLDDDTIPGDGVDGDNNDNNQEQDDLPGLELCFGR